MFLAQRRPREKGYQWTPFADLRPGKTWPGKMWPNTKEGGMALPRSLRDVVPTTCARRAT